MFWMFGIEEVVKVMQIKEIHCLKGVRIWSYSGPHFPAFELNIGICEPELLQIQTLFTQ